MAALVVNTSGQIGQLSSLGLAALDFEATVGGGGGIGGAG